MLQLSLFNWISVFSVAAEQPRDASASMRRSCYRLTWGGLMVAGRSLVVVSPIHSTATEGETLGGRPKSRERCLPLWETSISRASGSSVWYESLANPQQECWQGAHTERTAACVFLFQREPGGCSDGAFHDLNSNDDIHHALLMLGEKRGVKVWMRSRPWGDHFQHGGWLLSRRVRLLIYSVEKERTRVRQIKVQTGAVPHLQCSSLITTGHIFISSSLIASCASANM